MKALISKNTIVLLMLLMTAAIAFGKAVSVTTEVDRPVIMAGQKQSVFLKVALKGCDLDHLEQRTPVNVSIVIDKSGSMSGEKIEKAREAAILALKRLKSSDIVSVVTYDNDVEVLVPATKMTKRNTIIRKIRSINANGGTALYAGVKEGSEEVRKFLSKQYANRVVLLSDGMANVGPDSPKALGKLGGELVKKGISVSTVGLGLGYNEDLMSRLAFKSDGGHYFAERASELASVFDKEFDRALSVVAQEVNIEIICGEGMRPVRILGREGQINGRRVNLDIQNIYSNHEKYAIIEVEIPAHSNGKVRQIASVRVNYHDMRNDKKDKFGQGLDVSFCDSQARVDSSMNKKVLADAVEQIAIERNQLALEMRDEGRIEEAKSVLIENCDYLRSNADTLGSKKLKIYSAENSYDAENLSERDWGRQRKAMRESQDLRKSQR